MFRVSDKLQLIASSALSQFMRICTTFVMLRKIGPKENGAYFLILYVAGFLISFGNFAIPLSVVQIRDLPEQSLFDTALVLDVAITAVYGLFTVGCGVFLSLTHADPKLWQIAIIIAVTNLLGAVYEVQLASLNRHLQFRAESRQNLIFSASTAVTGMTFALLGWGVYAIALQLLVGQLIANIAVIIRMPLKWPRHASLQISKRLIRLGIPISASLYVATIEGSIIGLVINSFAGETGVGLWGKTVQIQGLFSQNLLNAFIRVAYPLLCRSANELDRLRILFFRVTRILIMVSLLFTVIVAVNSVELVRIFMASKWLAAAPLLSVAAWAIPAGALYAAGYVMCLALGTGKSLLRISALNLVLFIPLIIFARPWGLVGLAICWSASRYFIGVSVISDGTRRIGVKLMLLCRQMVGMLIAAAVSAGAMMLARHWTTGHVNALVGLSLVCSVGVGVYALVALVTERETFLYAFRLARGSREMESGSDFSGAKPIEALTINAIHPADSASFFLSSSGVQDETTLRNSLDPTDLPTSKDDL